MTEEEKDTSDITNTIIGVIKDRVGSPMYGTFILSWLAVNRKVWYITFFVDSNLIKEGVYTTKIDYIVQLYSFNSYLSFEFICTISRLLVIPSLMVVLFIWIISKGDFLVYKKYSENKNAKQILKNRLDANLLRTEEKKLSAIVDVKKAKKKVEKSKTEEEIWKEEYNKLKDNGNFLGAMKELKYCLYSERGALRDFRSEQIISESNLGILDTTLLIDIDFKDNQLSLTSKGKFFMNNFIN